MKKTVKFEKVGPFVIDPNVEFVLKEDGNGTKIDCELLDLHCYGSDLDAAMDNLPPSIFIFDDRIEVFSYGKKYPWHRNDRQHRWRKPVNSALYDMFLYAGLQESEGNGMRTIIERYGIDCIEDDGRFFTVTIPFSFEPEWVIAERASNERKCR